MTAVANSTSPIACTNVGSNTTALSCCYANDINSAACQRVFSQRDGLLQLGCRSQDCLNSCSNTTALYTSLWQDDLRGEALGPIQRYEACVNVPAISMALDEQKLGSYASTARQSLGGNATDFQLREITAALTDCLVMTCQNARGVDDCSSFSSSCAPTRLLTTSITPNITAVDECMSKLCSMDTEALTYADTDVVGIGVFLSYLLQCFLLILLCLGFMFSAGRRKWKTKRRTGLPVNRRHEETWTNLLLEFHKTQCYFCGTLMIASLISGVYDTDLVIVFMLMPLATNGTLPVSFAYLMLIYFWKSSVGITVLTAVVYILSSVVYWSLYAQLIPIAGRTSEYATYEQFMYKLSAIPACGGYSALAACPKNRSLGSGAVPEASYRLRVLTPMIWTFSTIVMIALLVLQFYQRRVQNIQPTVAEKGTERRYVPAEEKKPRIWNIVFWTSTIIFLAGMCMQLSLLAIAPSLQMMSSRDWSFGQIVAITIWTPPILEYCYKEISKVISASCS